MAKLLKASSKTIKGFIKPNIASNNKHFELHPIWSIIRWQTWGKKHFEFYWKTKFLVNKSFIHFYSDLIYFNKIILKIFKFKFNWKQLKKTSLIKTIKHYKNCFGKIFYDSIKRRRRRRSLFIGSFKVFLGSEF